MLLCPRGPFAAPIVIAKIQQSESFAANVVGGCVSLVSNARLRMQWMKNSAVLVVAICPRLFSNAFSKLKSSLNSAIRLERERTLLRS